MNKEPFTERLKAELAQGAKNIHIKEQVKGMTYAELAVTSLDGSSLYPANPISTVKLRFQTLISGAVFIQGNYRLDNCHGLLHSHFCGSIASVPISTLQEACLMMCGSAWGRQEQ